MLLRTCLPTAAGTYNPLGQDEQGPLTQIQAVMSHVCTGCDQGDVSHPLFKLPLELQVRSLEAIIVGCLDLRLCDMLICHSCVPVMSVLHVVTQHVFCPAASTCSQPGPQHYGAHAVIGS